MELKTLDELNREFKKEVMDSPEEDLVEYTKPAEVKSLSELNCEFRVKMLDDIHKSLSKKAEIKNESVPDVKSKSNFEEIDTVITTTAKKVKKQRSLFAVISDMLFYLAIFTVLVAIDVRLDFTQILRFV